jgi:hypothetical protein
MKRTLFIGMLMLLFAIGTKAQSLVGRVYSNPNIMAGMIEEQLKKVDFQKEMDEAVTKAEEKKGRKLTDKEIAKVRQETEENIKMAEAIIKGMSTAISVEFKSDTEAIYRMKLKIDDNALKTAGVSWLKRQTLKTALALAPESEKATYIVEGDLVIFDPKNDPDTLRLSPDRKQISGMMDEETPFTLTLTE